MKFYGLVAVLLALLMGKSGSIAAYDLSTGTSLWSLKATLGVESGRSSYVRPGAWLIGDSLFISTDEGLYKLNPRNGRVHWKCPSIGDRVLELEERPDGNLYVLHEMYPAFLRKSLEKAVKTRYPWDKDGSVVSAMIPYKNGKTYFARVYSRGDQGREQESVWEYLDGKWSWIFDYSPKMQNAQRDVLFARHGFSSWMRKRLEIGW